MAENRTLLFGYNFDLRRRDGIGRYANELHKGLTKKNYNHEILELDNIIHPLKVGRLHSLVPYMARRYGIIHIIQPELGWFTRSNAKVKIVTWHDMMLFTRTKKDRVRKIYHNMSGEMAYKNSDIIMCNSSKTMEEVKKYFGNDKSKKFFVISHGIGDRFVDASIYHGKRKDFVYVGSTKQPHKNMDGLLKAFNQIAHVDNRQVLHIMPSPVDPKGVLEEKAKSIGLPRKNLQIHYGAIDKDIIRVSKRCVANLHLSTQEGQGLPIIEAMAVGTPAIVLKDASIPKEISKYAIKVSENEVAAKALDLIHAHKPLDKKAIEYAKSFTYDRTVNEVIKVYKYAAKSF